MQTLNSYLKTIGLKTATIRTHESAVYDFSNWAQDQNIEAKHATYNELLGYMQHLQKRGCSQRTIQLYMSGITHYYKWLVEIGVRLDQPTQGIVVKGAHRKRLHTIIAMKDLESLYDSFKPNTEYLSGTYRVWHKTAHINSITQKVVYGLIVWQGLGSSELSALKVSDIQLREGKIYIPGVHRSNERVLTLQALQIMDIMEYIHQIRPEYLKGNTEPTEKLFVAMGGGVWGSNFLNRLIKTLSGHNPHITSLQQLRTCVITHWLKTNNLRQVQYMAGHRFVSSTEAYLVNDLDDLMEDIGKFHPLG
jgi:site-specific recombinase XerD